MATRHGVRRACSAHTGSMDRGSEIADFLRSRRARITPDPAGLPENGRARRVFESFQPPGDPDRTRCFYNAEPGSASVDALRLLHSWTTPESSPTEPGPMDRSRGGEARIERARLTCTSRPNHDRSLDSAGALAALEPPGVDQIARDSARTFDEARRTGQ
jgi:hypothetical protein